MGTNGQKCRKEQNQRDGAEGAEPNAESEGHEQRSKKTKSGGRGHVRAVSEP